MLCDKSKKNRQGLRIFIRIDIKAKMSQQNLSTSSFKKFLFRILLPLAGGVADRRLSIYIVIEKK
jgi:hypothetical protein